MLKNLHHITLLVRDLEISIARYQETFGLHFSERESLPKRGVDTARARVGETWLVLVAPFDETSELAQRLKSQGEGVLLISFGVTDLDGALAQLDSTLLPNGRAAIRSGVDSWRVADLNPAQLFGAPLQLTEIT